MASFSGKLSLISKCLVTFFFFFFCHIFILFLFSFCWHSSFRLFVGPGYLHTCDVVCVRPRAPVLDLLSLCTCADLAWH